MDSSDTASSAPSRQAQQAAMLAEAAERPGVREAIEVYGTIAPYAGLQLDPGTAPTFYAAGGNA